MRFVRRIGLALVSVAVAGGVCLAAALGVTAYRLGPIPLHRADALSVTVLDREERLLRAFTTAEGRWRLPVEPKDVDQRYLALLVAVEDRRFYAHPGVDPLALGRAALQLAGHLRIMSGGSTLTMQAARLLDGVHERSFAGKLEQIARALQLERRLSKTAVLRLYLRLAPFGGNLEGVRAASLAYFGKEPRRLSAAEAALLVALPQAPEARRPDRHPNAARAARDRVLARAAALGALPAAEVERARREPVPRVRHEFPKLAPHLAEAEAAAAPARAVHRLTLDRDVQGRLEALAREQAHALGGKLSAAILAVENATGDVIAHVGAADYLDESRLGAIDMVGAVRSPGSTLKPLIYALAFEAGLAHPGTLIEDRPARFGIYVPRNFDEDFRGTIPIREALAQSLNVPAVKVLNAVRPGKLVARFRRAGLDPVLPTGAEPTLAIALGGIGLRLSDLAALYACLARGGETVRLRHVPSCGENQERGGFAPEGRALPWTQNLNSSSEGAGCGRRRPKERPLVSATAAWYVTDILKDAPPPAGARAGRIPYKTGTSYGYRDAWAVGYDGRHTIAVWVGRADGAATPGLTGRTAAAPILFDAFARVSERRAPLPSAPPGIIAAHAASLPPPLKRFAEAGEANDQGPFLEPPVSIVFPPDRAELELEAQGDAVVLKAEGGALPLTWLIDGAPIASSPHAREVAWQPDGRGFVKVLVIDAKGRVDRVVVRLR